jgi:hypothetical protein
VSFNPQQLHTGGRKLAQLNTLNGLPIALTSEGAAVVALEWDYAAWTQNAANFVAQFKAATFGGKAPTEHLIALAYRLTPVCQSLCVHCSVCAESNEGAEARIRAHGI